MDLSGANSYDGGTIVNGGTLFLNTASPLQATSPVTVSATGGGTANYTLNAINQTIGALTLGGADSTSTSVNNVVVNPSGTLTLSDTVTYLATNNPLGSTIGPSGTGAGTVALGGNRTFAIADSTSTINELIISIPVSGSGQSLIKAGAGRLYLSGANTYDGGTVLNGGRCFPRCERHARLEREP
jgi:fibronectin-binding autotransporter adhesin